MAAPSLKSVNHALTQEGQLTPRERLARLLDPAMPFLEIGNIWPVIWSIPKTKPSRFQAPRLLRVLVLSLVCAVWLLWMTVAIMAGSLTTAGGYRLRRAEQISLEQKLPFVHLVESAGGDLMNYTVEGL